MAELGNGETVWIVKNDLGSATGSRGFKNLEVTKAELGNWETGNFLSVTTHKVKWPPYSTACLSIVYCLPTSALPIQPTHIFYLI